MFFPDNRKILNERYKSNYLSFCMRSCQVVVMTIVDLIDDLLSRSIYSYKHTSTVVHNNSIDVKVNNLKTIINGVV